MIANGHARHVTRDPGTQLMAAHGRLHDSWFQRLAAGTNDRVRLMTA